MASSAIQELIQDVDNQLHGSITIVVLGASGDLAKKKTFPSLFGLYRNGFLPKNTRIIGYARTKMNRDEFVKRATEHIKLGESPDAKTKLSQFLELTTYHAGKYDEDASWEDLARYVEKVEGNTEKKNRLFYVALPPSVFLDVAKGVRNHVYSDGYINRIVIEKPFGKDLESSRELGTNIAKLFKEDEIYRIDHYLGKEMVKNLMTLRFANVFFGQIWDRRNIDNVQITFKEPFGTEGRGGYFDEFGIIRDVMQNHLLQVLSLVAMERPIATDAEAIRDEKVKVLRCIEPLKLENALLGQYVGNEDKPSYKEDDSLKNKDTNCPTFAALVAYIHNERWEGVPFIMKAGKALNEPKVEIRIQFRNVAGHLFKGAPRNELVLRIQPSEAVYMKFNNKHPGLSYQTLQTDLDLTYHRRYSDLKIPDAYEALILDVLRGDHSNFVRDDELDAAWKIFTPILHEIEQKKIQPKEYKYGSRGPAELDDFMTKYGYDRSGAQGYKWPVQSVHGDLE
ncbi:Glucose-6-phosphate 1-dehydrogenase [Umbelopsis nana]